MTLEQIQPMAGIELAKQGKCGVCSAPIHHGPWTDEQIAEIVADTGEPEFEDWCDSCFVQMVAGGDAPYAAKLLGRPVQVGFTAVLEAAVGKAAP